MATSPLHASLADRIVDHIASSGMQTGQRLTERGLADLLLVSRTPVRNALRLLQEAGVVQPGEKGGFLIAKAESIPPIAPPPIREDESTYIRIASDRLNGVLPERITENELARRYELTRSGLAAVLRRMSNEGWIERLPAHGWMFLPVLTSLEGYRDSYRFRLLIEPAALLEPGWELDERSIGNCRDQQQWLVDGGVYRVSDSELFELNSGMHERLIECCNNSFFIDGLKRVDRLRRLFDYRQMLDRASAHDRCVEHVEMLDLALQRRTVDASAYMTRHLSELSVIKTKLRQKSIDEVVAG